MHDMLSHDRTVCTYPFRGLWLDIGRHEDYASAYEMFELHQQRFLPGESSERGSLPKIQQTGDSQFGDGE